MQIQAQCMEIHIYGQIYIERECRFTCRYRYTYQTGIVLTIKGWYDSKYISRNIVIKCTYFVIHDKRTVEKQYVWHIVSIWVLTFMSTAGELRLEKNPVNWYVNCLPRHVLQRTCDEHTFPCSLIDSLLCNWNQIHPHEYICCVISISSNLYLAYDNKSELKIMIMSILMSLTCSAIFW